MADNIGYTPGAGAIIASDDIGGLQHQRIKVVIGSDGVSNGDVSSTNPMPVVVSTGELVEAMESLRIAIQALSRSGLGQAMPDAAARLRVALDSISASLTLAAVTTVSTVSTLTNQTQIGGFAATEQIPAMMRIGAETMRRNITVT